MSFTVNNVIIPNFPVVSTTNIFNTIWKLTRAMKKAGWKYMSSSDGVTKDSSADPANDKWLSNTTTNPGASAASIATPSRGRALVTGLSGIVSTDKGKFLLISGAATAANNHMHQIEEIISSTSVKIDARTFAVASDANNGALTWSIIDPTGGAYPSVTLAAAQCWWNARGPSTLKIPITSAVVLGSSGFAFIRGENVVQTTTGAEGEIVGYVFDGVSTGYIVVAPRLRGTGSDPYGWGTGNLITGALTGATVTQVGTTLEYRSEVVIAKAANETSGIIAFGNFEPVGDNAQMFSVLAGQAQATATVFPGGITTTIAVGSNNVSLPQATINVASTTSFAAGPGTIYVVTTNGPQAVTYTSTSGGNQFTGCSGGTGTMNTNNAVGNFPTFAYIALGVGTGPTNVLSWDTDAGSSVCTNAQLMCVDLIEEQNYSADGSWTWAVGNTNVTGGSHTGRGFYRVDDSEDGDVDPYISFSLMGGVTLYAGTQVSKSTNTAGAVADIFTSNNQIFGSSGTGTVAFRCWRRRGLSSGNIYQELEVFVDQAGQTNSIVSKANTNTPDEVATAIVTTKVREPIRVGSVQTSFKMRKGTIRWFWVVQGGNGTDTYDSKKFIQLSGTNGCIVVGPWDGVTVPNLT